MMTPTIATNPLYQHFAPQQIEDEQQKSVLLELVNDTKNIAQVFPLMNNQQQTNQNNSSNLKPESNQIPTRSLPLIRQQTLPNEGHRLLNSNNSLNYNSYNTYETDGKENHITVVTRHPLSLNVQKYDRNPAYNSRSGSFNVQYPITPGGINSQPITPSAHAKAPVTPFLSVQPQGPYRAVSAELLAPHDDSDLRRKSFDNLSNGYRRPPPGQQRRLLPSTEHLEKQKSEDITTTRYDVPQIVAPHNDEEAPPLPRRRASFLPRSDAIESPYPRKQNSSPLPQHKIYERGHIYSRSWNAEFYDENEDRQYRQRYAEDIRIEDPRRYYHSGGQSSHSKLPPVPPPLPPPLPPPPIPSHMLVPPQITFTRQTKSFDSPNSTSPSAFSNDLIPSSPTQSQRYPLSLERRSFSERDRQQQQQQQQQQHHHQINRQLQPASEVSRECQGLWQARNVLEFTSPQNLSTDLSDDGPPSVISTSFESNTESLHLGDSKQKTQTSKGKPLLDLPRQSSNADTKRQKYRSLLEYRQLQRTCPETNSFESATSDSTSKFGSSLDSANSEELKKEQHKPKGPRYRSMMHLTRKPTNLQKTIAKRTFSAKYIATKSLIRPFFNQGASCEIQRDYSVDIKSDSLFRDFVRVDPRFENSKAKPVQIDYPKGFKPAPRRRSSQIMLAMSQYRSADNATFQYQQHQQHFQPNLRLPASPEIKGSHHNIYPY